MVSKDILELLSVVTEEEQAFLNGRDKIDRSLYMEDRCSTVTVKSSGA